MLAEETIGFIRILTLDRPEAGNALSRALARSLQEAIEVAATSDDVRAVVIAGRGGKFFCTGGDVAEYARLSDRDDLLETVEQLERCFRAIALAPLPVVAAVDGYALGAGAELALACDLRVISTSARIGLPQTKIGVIPSSFTLQGLADTFGYALAFDLAARGDILSGEEAVARGLATVASPPGEAHARAVALCEDLGMRSGEAIAAVKRLLKRADGGSSEMKSRFQESFTALWFSEFHREAERAFLEKREKLAPSGSDPRSPTRAIP